MDSGSAPRPGAWPLDLVGVTQVPRGPALVLAPEASIASAVEAMRRRSRGAAIVARNHRPIGVLTDRDILGWGHARRQPHPDLADPHLLVESVMTPCTEALRDHDTVGSALRSMCARGQWHLPIVCRRGLLLGALDIADVSLWLRDRMTLSSVEACFAEGGPL